MTLDLVARPPREKGETYASKESCEEGARKEGCKEGRREEEITL